MRVELWRMAAGLTLALSAPLAAAAADPANEVKAGVEAWSRGDFATAIRKWEPAAAAGDADAQFNLAQAYKLGKGVPADLKRAEALYLQAAQQGHLQAADNYGLLLFQSGRREAAMAWIVPSAERGEPRAQYVLGIAHFNGDLVPDDPVRAYALMTRAAATGLDQARTALATMDQALTLEERQKGTALAAELEAKANSLRATQLAAVDLGTATVAPKRAKTAAGPKPSPASPPVMVTIANSPPPRVVAVLPAPAPKAIDAAPAARPLSPAPSTGAWRIQLGAFGVPGNAEALWTRLKDRPALAGRQRFMVPAGKLTKLQAGPFASKAEADAACAALAGQACLALKP